MIPLSEFSLGILTATLIIFSLRSLMNPGPWFQCPRCDAFHRINGEVVLKRPADADDERLALCPDCVLAQAAQRQREREFLK